MHLNLTNLTFWIQKTATCLSGAWPYATFLLITIIINHWLHLLKTIDDMVIYSNNYGSIEIFLHNRKYNNSMYNIDLWNVVRINAITTNPSWCMLLVFVGCSRISPKWITCIKTVLNIVSNTWYSGFEVYEKSSVIDIIHVIRYSLKLYRAYFIKSICSHTLTQYVS